ncbi:MAG: hypothetical protein GY851_30765 [bacterium]|nr:hypothetical protein [bacterium]
MGLLDLFGKLRAMPGRRQFGVFLCILLFFFVSGACGLLYQVVWTRKLVLLFGTTSYAVSTVLSIFFLGLGVGSLWGGRLADRTRRPLFLYGVFEIVIGLWAVGFIFSIGWGESIVVAVLRAAGSSREVGVVLRGVLSLVFLIVPVTLMGATLPLLAKYVGQESRLRGLRIGALYSINTFGAVAGCALAGFALLPALGYTNATYVGAIGNIGVGVLAIVLARWLPRHHVDEPTPGTPSTHEVIDAVAVPAPRIAWVVVLGFGVSGFCALALEVLWTRMLVIVFLGTTYAFTTMLTSLLCGIAVGSAFASFIVDRRKCPFALFGFVEMLVGIACIAMLPVFAWLPERLAQLQVDVGFDWHRVVWVKFLLSFAVLFAPTFLFGMTFPIVIRAVAASGSRLGRDIGWVYSANTFGGVLGALAGGYLLIPMLGTQGGVVFLGLVLFAVGAVVLMTAPDLGWGARRAPLAVGLLILAWVAYALKVPTALASVPELVQNGFPLLGTPTGLAMIALAAFIAVAGALFLLPTVGGLRKAGILILTVAGLCVAFAYRPENIANALNQAYMPPEHEQIYFQEGVEGTVVVVQPKGDNSGTNRVLYINGVQATASIEKGVKMNRLQGVLPLLFDRDPRTVLFMCFGSGITAGTLGLSDFDRIDAVEISRDVLDAAPLFSSDNLGVIDRPQMNFIVDDGRNYLLTTDNRYDVITFEPMPLALAGVSTFYTRDYYDLCMARLNPGGLVSQWIPLHSLNVEVVRSLVLTFTEVFPEYCAWFVNADLFLVGSDQEIRIDYAAAKQRLSDPVIRKALTDVGFMDMQELLTCFFMGKQGVDAFALGEPVTDDRPWAEFVAPKLVYAGQGTVAESLRALQPLFESPGRFTTYDGLSPEDAAAIPDTVELRHRAKVHDLQGLELYYGGTVGGSQEEHFKQALRVDPLDFNARYYLRQIMLQSVRLKMRWEEYEKAEAYLTDLAQYLPNTPDLHLLLGDARFQLGHGEAARESYRRYLDLGGAEPRASTRSN